MLEQSLAGRLPQTRDVHLGRAAGAPRPRLNEQPLPIGWRERSEPLDQAHELRELARSSVEQHLPDGAGAQSIALALERGRSRAVAFLLLKAGHGVKDAFIAPAEGAGEQRRMLGELEAMGAVEVDPAHVPRALARALGDGAAHGTPPAPGLVNIAEVWPGAALRPQPGDTRAILAELDPEGAVAALSPQARGRLVGESADWPERFALIDSWFEDNAAVRALLDEPASGRALVRRLWDHLEERRNWWALQCARSAAVLRAAEPKGRDWRSFAAVAAALLEGRALRRTPITERVLEATLLAAAARRHDAALDALDDVEDDPAPGERGALAGAPRPRPAPAGPGEFERRLAGSGVDPAWVDGLATAAAVSPEAASPLGWLMGVVQAVEHRDEASLERFLKLLILRADAAAASPAATAERLAALDAGSRARWAPPLLTHRGERGFRSAGDRAWVSGGPLMMARRATSPGPDAHFDR